jgi:hypothetical protein
MQFIYGYVHVVPHSTKSVGLVYGYAPMVPHYTKFFVFCSPTSINAGCDAYATTTTCK